MYCSKCSKEIMDEAVICPNCGCPTNNYSSNSVTQNTTKNFSKDYPIIKNFAEKAQTLQTLGIFAAVLMFGIEIIFSIIIWINANNITIPEATTKDPSELAVLELAKKKYNLGKKLAMLPIIGIGISIFIGSIIGTLSTL